MCIVQCVSNQYQYFVYFLNSKFQFLYEKFLWEQKFLLTIHLNIPFLSNNCADSYTYLAEFQNSPGPLKAKWTTNKPTLQSRKDDTHTYIAHQIREIVPRGGAKIINDFFFNLACQKGPCHLRKIFKARMYIYLCFKAKYLSLFYVYGLRNQRETSSGVKLSSFV